MTPRFNPIPHAHPPALQRLVESLGPLRPATTWDKTVERTLNGVPDPHLYLGRALADRIPWLLQRELLTAHAHLLGGSRSGKTSLGLMSLIAQLVAHGDSSVVVIDLKGDNALFWTAFVEATRTGLPFKWFTLQPGAASFAFNPFAQWFDRFRSVNARSQSYLTALDLYFGEAYGKGFFGTVSLDTFSRFLTHFRDVKSFADLSRYAEEPGSFAATHTDADDSKHLRMVLRQLAAVRPLNVTEHSRPAVAPTVLDHAIDMSGVVTRPQVVYFSLASLEDSLTAKSVGKLALYAVVQAASVMRRLGPTVPVYMVLDEFQQLVAHNVKIMLEMARAVGVHLVLSHQDVSQLKTDEFDIASTIESSTTLKLVFEASSSAGLRYMQETGGEVRERTLNWMQALPAGFDEANDAHLSPEFAIARFPFELPTASVSEQVRPRLSTNEILAHSSHPLRGFARSRADGGLTQYQGQWTAVEFEYPTTAAEYKARSGTPLPTEHPSCVTVTDTGDGPEPETSLPNKPLPVPKPPRSADRAIADRLKALNDSIRNRPASGSGRP